MFESPPLEDEVRVAGRLTADHLVASEDDTWVTAVAYERSPDGDTRVFARGFWNSRFRTVVDDERGTPTDRGYRVPVECRDIDWTLSEGSRFGLVVAADNEDWGRHDSSNEGTNQVVLEESALWYDGIAAGSDAATFPTATFSREADASVYTAGQTAKVTITADSTTEDALVRDRLPEGWEIVGGDDHSTDTVEGVTYVEFDEPVADGESVQYYAEASEDTGDYEFGPVEYSATGDLWATFDATASKTVVGIDTSH